MKTFSFVHRSTLILTALLILGATHIVEATSHYFRVTDNGGAILRYTSFSDFTSNTNFSVLGSVGVYGDDAGFFYDFARESIVRVTGPPPQGGVLEYADLLAFVSGGPFTFQGANSAYGDDAGFFYDPTQNAYIRVADNGGILRYSSLAALGSNSGFIVDGNVNVYGNDAGFFYDQDRSSYVRIADNGAVLEYSSYSDFITGSNVSIRGGNGAYGNDAGFFMIANVPDSGATLLLFGIGLIGLFAVYRVSQKNREATIH